MKKILVLIVGMFFAFQYGAHADKPYTPPQVPNVADDLKNVHSEEDNCSDISPIHGQNCNGNGKHNGNGNGKDK